MLNTTTHNFNVYFDYYYCFCFSSRFATFAAPYFLAQIPTSLDWDKLLDHNGVMRTVFVLAAPQLDPALPASHKQTRAKPGAALKTPL